MDVVRNVFKEAIAGFRPVIGTWLMSGSASTAEALGSSGLDFVVVDMEHTPIDVPQTLDILRALAGTRAEAVTRVPWNDAVIVKRVLDAGAQSNGLLSGMPKGPLHRAKARCDPARAWR